MLTAVPVTFRLEPADETFFATAAVIHRFVVRLAATPEQVFESLASDESLAAWGPGVRAVQWLDQRPFGVGTTRAVTLAGGVTTVRERFFRWEPNFGYSFYVYESTLPGLRRLAENYVLEPDGDATTLIWTIAMEPKRNIGRTSRLLGLMTKSAFGRMAADGKRYFVKLPVV